MSSWTRPFGNKIVVLLLLAITAMMVILIFWPSTADAQCSMCRAVVGSNLESGDGVKGRGINTAILYLMAAPYVLVAIIGYVFFGDKIKAKFKKNTA